LAISKYTVPYRRIQVKAAVIIYCFPFGCFVLQGLCDEATRPRNKASDGKHKEDKTIRGRYDNLHNDALRAAEQCVIGR